MLSLTDFLSKLTLLWILAAFERSLMEVETASLSERSFL